jgi:imidazolonepropionase-like amidohydrolase
VVTFKAFSSQSTFQTGRFPLSEYVSPSVRGLWRQWAGQSNMDEYVWRNWATMVSGLNRAGVPLMVGTDLMLPGVLPGFSVHEEMAIWQDAGIPPADVLRGATMVPAQFMGLGDRLGTVGEGKAASLVLVRASPLDDVRNARQIEGVFLRGRYFSRDDVNQLLVEARALAHPAS